MKIELSRRREGYVYLYIEESSSHKVFTDKSIVDEMTNKYYTIDKEINEFKGFSAYKGIVRGTVYNMKKDISKLGDLKDYVLVTYMTKPDDLSIVRNAKAIITDEGRLLSHAVIVARELKKPCIVSTKVATHVLNTGDFIEVDAYKGIVKIIKKAK